MGLAKSMFLRNKDDVKAALGIANSDVFERMLVCAKADFCATNPSRENLVGANKVLEILQDLPEMESPDIQPISTGIDHEFSVPDRTKPPNTETK